MGRQMKNKVLEGIKEKATDVYRKILKKKTTDFPGIYL